MINCFSGRFSEGEDVIIIDESNFSNADYFKKALRIGSTGVVNKPHKTDNNRYMIDFDNGTRSSVFGKDMMRIERQGDEFHIICKGTSKFTVSTGW